jgi:hypothetical protein
MKLFSRFGRPRHDRIVLHNAVSGHAMQWGEAGGGRAGGGLWGWQKEGARLGLVFV